MKKTRELKGMPVLTLQEGERLGQVRELILDPVARQVVALVLDRRVGGEDQIIATANIRNVGSAAITVENRSSLIPLSGIPRFQELARMGKPIHGKMVLSETGARLGQVDDLEVDVQTFRLVSLVLKGFLRRGQVISTDLVRTIGADAIIVCEEKPQGEALPAPPPGPAPESFRPPVPAQGEEPLSMRMPAESPPPPETSAPHPGEPDAAPPGAELSAPAGATEAAAGPADEGDANAWQRWVRRLKTG